jgi:hypothetical protein
MKTPSQLGKFTKACMALATRQVWQCGEQPGVVEAVSGAGRHVPGLQRGAGDKTGYWSPLTGSCLVCYTSFSGGFLQSP